MATRRCAKLPANKPGGGDKFSFIRHYRTSGTDALRDLCIRYRNENVSIFTGILQ